MSREIKRVALDFEWPLNKVWHGYLINTCIDERCDDCRLFGKIKGLAFTSYDCPIFEAYEPPKGEGWQMWETTSEGSPISPVMESPEILAEWLVDNNASSFGRNTATYEQWLATIKAGWVISAVCDSKGFRSGVEAAPDYQGQKQ